MKVILVTKNKKEIEKEFNLNDIENAGVLIMKDAMANPPIRVFAYRQMRPAFNSIPYFDEVDYMFVDMIQDKNEG